MIEVREPVVGSVRAAIVSLRKRRIGPMSDGYYHVHGMSDPGGCEALARFFPERPGPVIVGLREDEQAERERAFALEFFGLHKE